MRPVPITDIMQGTGLAEWETVEINVKDPPWRAKGDGVTDDTAAIQAAIDSCPEGSSIVFPKGNYIVTELVLSGRCYIKLSGICSPGGTKGSKIIGVAATTSIINLVDSRYDLLENIEIYAGNPAAPPKCCLIMGRRTVASMGNHIFRNVFIDGYVSETLVYDVASEINNWYDCQFTLLGGGGKYCYYTAPSDVLTIDPTLFACTNTEKHFWGCHCWSTIVDPTQALIVLDGYGTGDISFTAQYWALDHPGIACKIIVRDVNFITGPLSFQDIRFEAINHPPGAVYEMFHITKVGGGPLRSLESLNISNCNMTEWGGDHGNTYWFIYAEDFIAAGSWQLNMNRGRNAISLYGSQGCLFLTPGGGAGGGEITIRGTSSHDTFIINNAGAAPVIGVNNGTLVFWNGTMIIPGVMNIGVTATAVWNPGSIANGAKEAKDVTVPGAALGDFAIASFTLDLLDLVLDAQVTAANTVTCVLANNTGGAVDLGSGTISVRLFKAV